MKTAIKRIVVFAAAVVVWVGVRPAAGSVQTNEPSRVDVEFFEKKIRPVLASNCYGCHSAQSRKPQGGLLLDSREGLLQGGGRGPAIVPGDPEKSLLIKAIRYTDEKLQMPPAGQLSAEQIADFEAWVKIGAPDPRVTSPAANWQPSDAARRFWSFEPVQEPALPAVRNKAWVNGPIDRFILSKIEAKGLHPVVDADKRTLIRRATFDLTGLPPKPEEVDAFLADKSPGAFAKVVDRLLASPGYGERWGRHWLDVVRYADTAGDNSDFPIPAAYRYRNYVIKSFNDDKPYDEFIREQIAGDLLQAKTAAEKNQKVIATGYLAMSRRFGSRNKEFNLTIDDTIDNLGKAFLGLSISCARCHDHKFDPIPTRDYYALYGIFNSSRYAFPGAEIYPHPADMVALASGREADTFYKWQKELADLDDRKEQLVAEKGTAARNKAQKDKQAKEAAEKSSNNDSTLPAQAPDAKSDAKAEAKKDVKDTTAPAEDLRPADFDRDARNWGLGQKSTRMPEEVDADASRVKARIAELNEQSPRAEKAYAVVDGVAANARIHRKGDPKSLGDEVPRGFLTILGGQQLPPGHKGSGRDHLARWITDPANPLTARVIVNRIWEYHFGKGIVRTPNDFGIRGRQPSHPELLDFLAKRFVEGGWSIKAMHRMIMNSHAYQIASVEDPRLAAIDADNDYFWRFERRRLSAEEMRDSMLAVSGALDPTMGQAQPFPAERDWRYTQHKQFFAVYDTNRRSVYLMQQRLKKHPLMEVFDGPDTNSSTAQRSLTTTPVQALYLMNDPFVHKQADNFAVRVGMAYETWPQRIDFAYRLALGRAASAEDVRVGTAYLQQMRLDLKATSLPMEQHTRAALASLLRVLLCSNDFLYLD